MKLIIEDDDGRKTVVPFARDEISIGRRDGNTIRLTERNVSRRHARLSRGTGHVFIEDLGSYNGVKVNGGRVQGRAEIKEGDLIEIGDYNLAIQLDATDVVPQAAAAETEQAPAEERSLHSAPTAPHQRPMAAPPPSAPEPITESGRAAPPPPKVTPQPAPAEAGRPEPQAPRRAPTPQASPAAPEAPAPQPAAPKAAAPKPAAPKPARPDPQAAAPAGRSAGPEAAPPSRAESTAVIRVDLEALNRSDERGPLPPEERPRLVGLSGEFAGRSFELDHTSSTIGRTVDNDVSLDHRSLSRHHCRVYLDKDGTWKVLDRGSANGVKVNGEDYGLIDLRRGDVIELGHVKLRFCDPGDPFVYSEDEKKAHSAGRQRALPDDEPAPKKSHLAPILAVAGLVGIAVAVGIVFLGGRLSGEEQPEIDGQAIASADLVREAIQSAGDAAEKERWSEAIRAYRHALNLDPTSAAASQGLQRVETEAEAHSHFEAMRAAMDAEAWEDAWNNLSEIADSSIYAERAAEHRDDIREGYVGLLVDRGHRALPDSAWDEAFGAAEAALSIAPGNEPATELMADAERGRARAERERQARVAEEERRQQLAEARQRRADQRRRQSAAKKTSNDSRTEAQEAFEQGNRHFQNNEVRQAITHLERAIRLDPRGQSRVHALLGTCYARLGDSDRAAMHYRRFLETNPNHPQAPQVQKILEDFERYSQQ